MPDISKSARILQALGTCGEMLDDPAASETVRRHLHSAYMELLFALVEDKCDVEYMDDGSIVVRPKGAWAHARGLAKNSPIFAASPAEMERERKTAREEVHDLKVPVSPDASKEAPPAAASVPVPVQADEESGERPEEIAEAANSAISGSGVPDEDAGNSAAPEEPVEKDAPVSEPAAERREAGIPAPDQEEKPGGEDRNGREMKETSADEAGTEEGYGQGDIDSMPPYTVTLPISPEHPLYGRVTRNGHEMRYGVDYIGYPPTGSEWSSGGKAGENAAADQSMRPAEAPQAVSAVAHAAVQAEAGATAAPVSEASGSAEKGRVSSPDEWREKSQAAPVQTTGDSVPSVPAPEEDEITGEFNDELFWKDFTFFYDYITIIDPNGEKQTADLVAAPLSMAEGSCRIIVWVEHEDPDIPREIAYTGVRKNVFVHVGGCAIEVSGTIVGGKFVPVVAMGAKERGEGYRMKEDSKLMSGTKGHVACYDEQIEAHVIPLAFKNNESGKADFLYYINYAGHEMWGDSYSGPLEFEYRGETLHLSAKWSNDRVLHVEPRLGP